MAKNRKGFNWKARQQNDAIPGTSGANVQLQSLESSGNVRKHQLSEVPAASEASDSNTLVLPAVKKTAGITRISVQSPKTKFVSHRQRKMQERLKDKQIKASKRGALIHAIQAVQATEEEMKQFISVTQMQTRGLKRHFLDLKRISKRRKKSPVPENDEVEDEEEADDSSDLSEPDEPSTAVVKRVISDSAEPSLATAEEVKIPSEKNSVKVESREEGPDVPDKIPTEIAVKKETANPFRGKHNVSVQRSPEVQESRGRLPVVSEEQAVMEAVNENPVVIICGETGSGKTTQLPQFLYEAGYASGNGIIGITEPRRVAAISMAKRVGYELNRPQEVSYQIRYEGNVNPKTRIKFMTDGVLTRELASDFLLQRYSVVVIDEAHERSVYTDVLIGLLSRIVVLREKRGIPLKLIIMSATLRVEDFAENKLLFAVPPPVIQIDSRQYPVSVHFNKRTPSEGEYLEEAYKKISKIHRELPAGGILVFVTGQQEVHALCSRLRESFPIRESRGPTAGFSGASIDGREKLKKKEVKFKVDAYPVNALDEEEGIAHVDDEDLAGMGPSDAAREGSFQAIAEPMYVLPLYSLLPSDKQALVFQAPPEGSRLCIVATNVAETSITIPDIKYVVDTGKTKMKLYDRNTGLSTFRVMWTSKAGANQRAGRAGRTSAGHCYRLYSSAIFNDNFPQFTPPEITRRPIDDIVLQMKAMNIEKIINFPFPSPPNRQSLMVAEEELLALEAVKLLKPGTSIEIGGSRISALGKIMSNFPVAPKFAKMLAISNQQGLMPYVITLIAALTVQELFVENLHDNEEQSEETKKRHAYLSQLKKRWIGSGYCKMLGDLMVLLKAVGAADFNGANEEYCREHCLRLKAVREIRQLRQQLANAVSLVTASDEVLINPETPPPNELQSKLILQIVLCCVGKKIARKLPHSVVDANKPEKHQLRHAYQTQNLEQLVYIHPNSVLFQEEPEYIIYQELFEGKKIYCRNVMEIRPEWIPKFLPQYCTFEKPDDTAEPFYDEKAGTILCQLASTFGPHGWPLPAVRTSHPEGIELYKNFGRFFLDGSVCPKLKRFADDLLAKPVIMIKTWANVQPKTFDCKILPNLKLGNQYWAESSENMGAISMHFILHVVKKQIIHTFRLSSEMVFSILSSPEKYSILLGPL